MTYTESAEKMTDEELEGVLLTPDGGVGPKMACLREIKNRIHQQYAEDMAGEDL